MPQLSPSVWAVVAAVALMVGLSKTGLPGLGILGVALLAAAVGGMESTGLMLPMLITGDVLAVIYYRRHANWKHLFRLVPSAVVGIVAGFYVLRFMQSHHWEKALNPFIGGLILVLVTTNRVLRTLQGGERGMQDRQSGASGSAPQSAFRNSPPSWLTSGPSAHVAATAVGVLAGVTTMMANAAGPFIVLYFLAMRLDKHEFIGTGAWYFLLLNCFKVPFSRGLNLITPESIAINLLMLPVIIGGAVAGVALLKRIPQKAFAAVVEVLVIVAAVYLLMP